MLPRLRLQLSQHQPSRCLATSRTALEHPSPFPHCVSMAHLTPTALTLHPNCLASVASAASTASAAHKVPTAGEAAMPPTLAARTAASQASTPAPSSATTAFGTTSPTPQLLPLPPLTTPPTPSAASTTLTHTTTITTTTTSPHTHR